MSFGAVMKMAMEGAAAAPGSPMFTGDPYNVFDTYPQPAIAGIEIDVDGGIEGFKGAGNIGDIGRWDGGGSFVRADYDFRVDLTTGTLSNDWDAEGVWHPGTSLVSFGVHVPVPIGLKRAIGTLRMRPTGGGVDIDTAPIQLEGDLT